MSHVELLRPVRQSAPMAIKRCNMTMMRMLCKRSRGLALLALAGLALALLWLLAGNQVGVVAYKVGLVFAGLLIGLAADTLAFPYAAPDGYLERDWHEVTFHVDPEGGCNTDFCADYPVVPGYERLFAAAQLRRAAIVVVSILAVCLGL